jgi:mono/diheme cytochrome c family protein
MMSVLSGKAGFLAAAINAVVIASVNTPLHAEDFDRGEALYKNHCKECHEGLAHSRLGSKINSVDELRNWVASWSVHSRLDWSEDDVEDVADYLNTRFYNLSDKP